VRLVGEFPEKRSGVFRILAIGDLLISGHGVAAADAYPAALEREIGSRFQVDVKKLFPTRRGKAIGSARRRRCLDSCHPGESRGPIGEVGELDKLETGFRQ
jgi:hypothetical protein